MLTLDDRLAKLQEEEEVRRAALEAGKIRIEEPAEKPESSQPRQQAPRPQQQGQDAPGK